MDISQEEVSGFTCVTMSGRLDAGTTPDAEKIFEVLALYHDDMDIRYSSACATNSIVSFNSDKEQREDETSEDDEIVH